MSDENRKNKMEGHRDNSGKMAYGLVPGTVWVALYNSHKGMIPNNNEATIAEIVMLVTKWAESTKTNDDLLVYAFNRLNVLITGKPAESPFCPAMDAAIKVLMFGAKKYAPNNWRFGKAQLSAHSILDSFLRHAAAITKGEDDDKPTDGIEDHQAPKWYVANGFSGLAHVAHMACNIIFLIYFSRADAHFDDDRFPKCPYPPR